MQRTFYNMMIIFLCVLMFSSCNNIQNEESLFIKETEYTIVEYDNETIIQVNESSENKECFIVKSKKYAFEGTNFVLLNVKNETAKNYSVTVTGTYLDKDGKVLKTETQTFDQSAAGYENFFLFDPKIVFDKFTYTLKTTETNAAMYATNLEATLSEIYEKEAPVEEMIQQGNFNLFPCIVASFEYKKNIDEVLDVRSQWVLFNEKDEVVSIISLGTFIWEEAEGQQWVLYYTTEETLEWPDEFKGNIRAVHILKSLEKGEIS